MSIKSFIVLSIVLVAGLCGCTSDKVDFTSEEYAQAVSLLMPETLEVMPFTQFQSFNDDQKPDGVALFLRPINTLGDPCNIVGVIHVQLAEWVPASGDREGEVAFTWDVPLMTRQAQEKHWNSTTQMYEFLLDFDAQNLRAMKAAKPKYLLSVIYNTPLNTNLLTEYTLETAPMKGTLGKD